jgi:hypothetical protein
LAISTAKVAIPPKPRTAAINATIRNVNAQPNLKISSGCPETVVRTGRN